MKLVIAGTRNLYALTVLKAGLIHWDLAYKLSEIVQGGAPGMDACAKKLAEEMFGRSKQFDADWKGWGKSAGPKRNREMAEYGDALLVIWDGESRGSANMKEEMIKTGKPVYEIILKQHNLKEDDKCKLNAPLQQLPSNS